MSSGDKYGACCCAADMVWSRESETERPPMSVILPRLYLGAERDVTQVRRTVVEEEKEEESLSISFTQGKVAMQLCTLKNSIACKILDLFVMISMLQSQSF